MKEQTMQFGMLLIISFLTLVFSNINANQVILEGQIPPGMNESIFVIETSKPVDIFGDQPTPIPVTTEETLLERRKGSIIDLDKVEDLVERVEKRIVSLEERVTLLERKESSTTGPAKKKPTRRLTYEFKRRFCGNRTGQYDSLYQLDANYGTWSDNFFCRVFYEEEATPTRDYSVSADFYNVVGPEGVNSGYLGIAFNAKDDFNFDVVYLRLHRPDQCFQAGYVERGLYHRSSSIETKNCPHGPPRGKTWFHFKVVVHPSDSVVTINGFRVAQFKHHFPSHNKAGLVVVAGRKNIVWVQNFNVTKIPPLPFKFHACSLTSQVSRNYYHIEAEQGSQWPNDGFCTAINHLTISEAGNYDVSVELHIRSKGDGPNSGIVGVAYNVQDGGNYDFVYFRPQSEGGCFTTGYVLSGRLKWTDAKLGACPGQPIRTLAWLKVTIRVTSNDVVMLLDGKHLVRTKSHYPNTGTGGVIVGNSEGNEVSFKGFKIRRAKPAPFQFTNCAPETKSIGNYHVLDGRHGSWPQSGFCRALYNKKLMADNYALTVMLYSQGNWGGELSNHVGVFYNAKDENNYEFIYFRPYSGGHCYTHGLVLNAQIQWSTVKDGACKTGPPKPKRWFTVKVSVRGDLAWIELNNNHLLTIPTQMRTHQTGGILAGNDNENVLAFKEFQMRAIKPYAFSFLSCGEQTHQINGSFMLSSISDESETSPNRLLCLALYHAERKKMNVIESGYMLGFEVNPVDSWIGKEWSNLGMAYNAEDENNYEFFIIRIRPASTCIIFGYVLNGEINFNDDKTKSCEYHWNFKKPWHHIRAIIDQQSVTISIDNIDIMTSTIRLEVKPLGGVIIQNGNENHLMFRQFEILSL